MISGKAREKTCSAVLRTRDLARFALYSYFWRVPTSCLQSVNLYHLLRSPGQISFLISDCIWWVSLHFGGIANIQLLCLSFQEHPLFAILFGLCKVQGWHDDHYLLNSVEVSLKTADQPNSTRVHRPWVRWTLNNDQWRKIQRNLLALVLLNLILTNKAWVCEYIKKLMGAQA